MELITERLVLRPWRDADAEALFELARDPKIGPRAGWAPHTSVAESRETIRTVLSGPETYAICLRGAEGDARCSGEDACQSPVLVGAISLMGADESDLVSGPDEWELGFWCGRPFWGRGIVPEAARVLIARARDERGARRVWCSFYAGNAQSLRAQEKLGFVFERVDRAVAVPRLGEVRDLVVGAIDFTLPPAEDRARALLEAQPDADRFRAVIEPLALGRTRVCLLDERLGVLTHYEPNGCYYAVPFSAEGARAMRDAIVPGSIVYVVDISFAGEIVPEDDPDHYEFWVYPHAEPPAMPAVEFTQRQLGSNDLETVAERYHLLSREEMLDHLERGWIWGGFDAAGSLVGFIGEHDEGSMGMLEVFPEARRHGYAQALEIAQMRRFMAAGRTPYCHVVPSNDASKALQTKLGLVRVGPEQCWVALPRHDVPLSPAPSSAE